MVARRLVNRRILLAGGLAGTLSVALSGAVDAQTTGRVPRIAVLEWEPAAGADRLIPFREALEADGYIDGRTIRIDTFFADGRQDMADSLAQTVARDGYDVIVAFATPVAHAAKRATARVPIVFGSADPLGTGLVTNLSRPGGNLTGVSSMLADVEGKRVFLLRDVLPDVERVAYLASSTDPAAPRFVAAAQEAGGKIGVTVMPQSVATPDLIEDAIDRAVTWGAQALLVQPLFTLSNHSAGIAAEIVVRRRLPAIGTYAPFARRGGLMTYGPALEFARRRSAQLVSKILAGADPGQIPVEQPTEFHFTLNAKAARSLGLTVPALLLARADEVIE
jgi:putative ABC transport system substrate-binding protein